MPGAGGVIPSAPEESLLGSLLAEQQSLVAVERFAQAHEAATEPLLAKHYRDLIPLERSPQPGEQLAFCVDLDACTGCKACVTACHSLNGLDPEEAWRDVGLVVLDDGCGARPQTVTTACHHCEEPACLLGCPTQAYEKDATTGIVRHLDDQCIGCQYCLLTCPYDAPRFDASRGIVRKCDMCADRLREGEAPACVQGCPTSAISIDIVSVDAVESAPSSLLPGSPRGEPNVQLTRPTTRYTTSRPVTAATSADASAARPAHAHAALCALLVLVQLSTGMLLIDRAAGFFSVAGASERTTLLLLAGLATAAGLIASVAHLGRPTQMFRAVLGWRTSWMTREILALGGYASLLAAALVSSFFGGPTNEFAWTALVAGLGASFCSVQVYAVTGRPWWSRARTARAFASTSVVLGATAIAALALATEEASVSRAIVAVAIAVGAGSAALLGWRRTVDEPTGDPALERSRTLLVGPLRRSARARVVSYVAGLSTLLLAVPTALVAPTAGAVLAGLALAALFIGALVDRALFFTAEAAPAMPGL